MPNSEYQFVNTDTNLLVSELISSYEQITGITVRPASPERLFIQWIADVIVQERVRNNYTGNQNIPSRSKGSNLDALGKEIYNNVTRPLAQAAICTQRFYISEVQDSAVLIPAGTKVTDKDSTLIWETTADVYVNIGELYADVMIQCQTTGTIGNRYAPGQIRTLVDIFLYYDYCENITESDDGADAATDEEYFELLRASQNSYSTAGPEGAYIYYAKRVSTQIEDVVVNSPDRGQVNIYALMNDGTVANEEIKNAIYTACNDKYIRPLTDFLVVADAEIVPYSIDFTYYISRTTTLSAVEIEAAVNTAVYEYIAWQRKKLGRDINPDELRQYIKAAGVKRIELVEPVFTVLRDGSDNSIPQVAAIGNISITSGGYEDE
ncbi:MAG: baseplate J/gp47 family protein [Sedimentibacter sp.]